MWMMKTGSAAGASGSGAPDIGYVALAKLKVFGQDDHERELHELRGLEGKNPRFSHALVLRTGFPISSVRMSSTNTAA
jgi:hypothetical protein